MVKSSRASGTNLIPDDFEFKHHNERTFHLSAEEEAKLHGDTESINIEDEYGVVSFSGKVHSNIRKDGIITEDFPLAVLPDKEKEYVTERLGDAYTVKALINKLSPAVGQRIFQQMTLRAQVIAIMHRNVKDNHLLSHYFNKDKEILETEVKEKNVQPKNSESSVNDSQA